MEITKSDKDIQGVKDYIVLFIYIVINSLFIIKYGENYNIPLLVFYVVAFPVFGLLYFKINLRTVVYKSLFFSGIFCFFFISIYLNYITDGNSLNVDRWSALEVGIKAILNGEYPYNIPDHMRRESSNLPVLIIIGMPFYLLFGSVGYLQSFCFLLFSYLVFKIFNNYKERLAVLLLLLLSPAYLWEVYVKSDLFSNFIIIAGFTYLVWGKLNVKKISKPDLVSFLAALVMLTRISSVIPLIIALLKKFWGFNLKEKIRFALVFILTAGVVIYIFFQNVPDLNTFIKHNPFMIQGAKQPLFLSILYIVIAVFLSFKVKSFYEVIYWSGMLLFVCVFVAFLIYIAEYGYTDTVINSFFDLSFFNMSMPFLLISIGYGFFKNNHLRQ
ncbi:hypothetical protein [Chryseobacterium taichungense]|uniref:hypothetical protein n=1 Tax=Chryseobacterium taichungense TaxID=295069 RepID=UPI0028B1D8E6|nr:hypothetical protein [Chryseobacterium taichungense]